MASPENSRILSQKQYPSLPCRTRLQLAISSFVTDFVTRPNGTINRRVLLLVDSFFHSPPNPSNPINAVTSSDVVIDPTRNLWCRVFVPISPPPNTSLPVVFFFHGGGFALLSANSVPYVVVCRRFARQLPAIVVSTNYRLTPEHKFPSQYDDGFDVLKFIDQQYGTLLPPFADVSKCFLAGDSAGGNLSHHVAIRFCRQKSDFRSLNVIGLICIQPFFGGEERTQSEIRLDPGYIVTISRTDWLWKVFLPTGCDRDHTAVNVSGPNAEDISGLEYPQTMVVVAGFDPLHDWQRSYYKWLKKSGKSAELIEYPNSIHAFYVFPELPESSHLIGQIKDFVAKCSSNAESKL